MTDKNGAELASGDIVEVSGAYMENDNGLYFIERSPGDPGWFGDDYLLRKICGDGKPCTDEDDFGFWPLPAFTNKRSELFQANAWNEENAKIEIRNDITGIYVADYFFKESDEYRAEYLYFFNHGKEAEAVKILNQAEYYRNIARRCARQNSKAQESEAEIHET